MAVVSYALTTLAEVKLLLNITNTEYDTLLEGLINSSTDYIENYCGRRFVSTVQTDEQITGNGSVALFVKQFPIIAFTKLEHRTGKATWEEIGSDNYWIDFDTGEVRSDSGEWIEGFQNYRATYTAGFATIPHDLNLACQQMVAHEFNTRGSSGGQVESESLGDYSVKYRAGSDESDKFIDGALIRYKKSKV